MMLGQGGGEGAAAAILFGGLGGWGIQIDWGVSIGKGSFVLKLVLLL